MDQPISIDTMLTAVADAGGSDLHICTGFVPVYRKDGKLYNLSQLLPVGICTDADMQDYIWQMVHREMARRGDAREDIDASYTSAVLNQKGNFVRCRMNAFHDRNGYSIALRLIPEGIPKMTDLRIPLSVRQLTQKEHGLVIVCGPTGSGKTTTLASMLESINETQDILFIGNAEVSAHLAFLNVGSVNRNHNFRLILHLDEHLHLAVGGKSRQHARRVIIVKEFPAKFQIELPPELRDSFTDFLGLQFRVFLRIKAFFVHHAPLVVVGFRKYITVYFNIIYLSTQGFLQKIKRVSVSFAIFVDDSQNGC